NKNGKVIIITEEVMDCQFIDPSAVVFTHTVTEGSADDVTGVQNGTTYELTATGSATVEVTATETLSIGATSKTITVVFNALEPAAPDSVVVQDQPGDNGHYVMVSFKNSSDHMAVTQYRIYREMMVNDAAGNPMAEWVSWAVVDAIPNDGVTRAVVPVTDNMATRWGVAAERGASSSEPVITPAGKRVFSKESVQAIVELLGVDPNLVVTEDELAQMFMPSADYISSLIGDRKNVVFAALDPDLGVLIGGDLAVPQNIRTGGHSPITTSKIIVANGGEMAGAMDDTPPAAVTDVAADAETGMVTWTMSADDMIVGTFSYRGHSMMIPGVTGYKVIGGASEDAMIDIGVAPAGSSSFQVPLALIETLINQGLPAVLVSVVAMDGTNMVPSVPLVVELVPTRRAFVDADGGPVYIVKLDRHGAMTPNIVDFEDFIAFTMAFNTDETHENWRVFVQADLNDDKMVNFEDFILFFSSYGKEAAGPAGKSLVTPVLGVNEAAELSLRLGSDRVVVGETMFVDVSLANVQALMGYGFVLNYDAEKFEFVEAVPAAEDLLLSSGGEIPLLRGWSPEAGQVHVMNAIVNGSEVSGGGDIVRLVFRVLRDFEDDARFEIAEGLVFDPQQFANPLAGGVLDIQTTPTEFALLQNFPNPFNPDTTIGYELAESADVTLQIYNVVGQVVRTLIAAEPQSVGRYQVRWNGMDDRGTPVSSGIYFYQISAGKFQDVRKLMLLK
ncbi:MAG: T9SS type A sorting domain-containing protein, partial [Gemmatimonadota bacterium]|nr:T9SS type A sorting domain-containing protein [Gemmatimonadota bacterium]